MMVKKRAVLALVVVVALCRGNSLAAPRPRLDVRTMAESATEAEAYAAEEFRDFFAQATGYDLPILSAAKNVFIGASESLKKSNVAHALDREYGEEELRVIIAIDNIAIVGGRPRGVLYGVYQFLEQSIGVRFLAPDCTYAPTYEPDDSETGHANTPRSPPPGRWVRSYREWPGAHARPDPAYQAPALRSAPRCRAGG